ncbi:MAG TPA: glycosyltransferase [Alphaproteobacteria bacterium]|nr:glycosyltransferase [Alphaproteobacteria bacterium]
MKPSLIALFDDAKVQYDRFEIISPRKQPLLLGLLNIFRIIKRPVVGKYQLGTKYQFIKNLVLKLMYYVEKTVVSTHSKILLATLLIIFLPLFLVVGLVVILFRFFVGICAFTKKSSFAKSLAKKTKISAHITVNSSTSSVFLAKNFLVFMKEKAIDKIYDFIDSLKDSWIALELFKILRTNEAMLMNNLINSRSDISAWYCPTAFWPDFNKVKAPRLMCVPDVVMTDFPIAFSLLRSNRALDSFMQIEKAIEGGQHFVTYSEEVKWRTLTQRYHIDPEKIFVVLHGDNSSDKLFSFSNTTSQNERVITTFCCNLLKDALFKSTNKMNRGIFVDTSNLKFMFYASQFRPNKNVISLLKAYEYLLKRRHIPHKLILTGNSKVFPEVQEFIKSHNLEYDVLFLHGLSTQQLAACYKLADLAVNPSLSEGGCPFTLTEALSVDTPVVMARIPVTLEVIKDPDLDKEMLFDPYDWRDMADRIEWALKNREELLAKQKIFYSILEKRTWEVVVDEYISILDHISTKDLGEENLMDAA